MTDFLEKANWEEQRLLVIKNIQQTSLAKMIYENELKLCDAELAKFPEEKTN